MRQPNHCSSIQINNTKRKGEDMRKMVVTAHQSGKGDKTISKIFQLYPSDKCFAIEGPSTQQLCLEVDSHNPEAPEK